VTAPGVGVAGTSPSADPTVRPTVAIALVTLSVGIGFGRLFTEGRFVVPVVVTVVLAHGVAWWCRRNQVPTGIAALATIGAAGVAASWTVLGHTTAYGIPIPYTLRVAAEELQLAREAFEVVKAPTPVMPGFLVALTLALGVAAFMSDWAAFRLHTAIEALVPAFTLFVFTAALGTDRYRIESVVAFVAASLAFLVVYGMTTRTRLAWFGGRPATGPGTIVRAALLLGGVAVLVGLLVSPVIPGYDSDPLVKYKNRGGAGPSSRSTISPLVDIQGRLIDRADIEVFSVVANERAYWRLTSLDTFDGTIWSSNTTYRPTRGGLGTEEELVPGIPTVGSTQQFTIRALDSIWLPAAFRPQQVTGIEGVSYNPDTASLITEDETTDGYTYTVESAIPAGIPPDLLAQSPARVPAAIAERYLALPDISDRVEDLSRRITANQPTPYAKARALQDFFHSGEFTYELSAQQGHGAGALENFLFRTKNGYCEQFAGAYAVMARVVGLPTRVAVGFTPGELGDDGAYHVRDEHAHAWPEVYLEGYGWMMFEPTVGRGAGNASSWTGRPEQQDAGGESTTATTATTLAPTSPSDETTPTSDPNLPDDLGGGAGAAGDVDEEPNTGLRVLGMIAAGAVLWAIVVPTLHWLRHRRRRMLMEGRAHRDRPAATPDSDLTDAEIDAEVAAAMEVADRVLAAWTEAAEALERAGVRRRSSETLMEFTSRAPASAGLQTEAATALRTLGRDAAQVTYASHVAAVAPDAAARATSAADAVRDAVLDQLTWVERVVWWLDPRPLVRDWRRTMTR
jgi:transglutaminase-like putative cysteine protease